MQSSHNTVIIKNSVLRNIGHKSSLYNGRVVDTRGNPQDTIIVENCAIYNIMAYMFEGTANNTLSYMKVNHNTVYGAGFLQYGVRVGDAKEAYVTNNVFYNMALLRSDYTHTPFFSADTVGSDPILRYADADRIIVFKNNNWYNDPGYDEITIALRQDTLVTYAFDDIEETNPIPYKHVPGDIFFADDRLLQLAEEGTVLDNRPTLLYLIDMGVADTANNFREELEFENPTPFKEEFWTAVMETQFQLSSLVDQPEFWDDEDLNLVPEVETGAYSFFYNTTGTRSGTAATDGGAIGIRKEGIVSLEDIPAPSSERSMVTTYPNPFQESVTFRIDTEINGMAEINIYNVHGSKVKTFKRRVMKGAEVVLPLSEISQPGMYFYTIKSNNSDAVLSGKLQKK